MDWRIFQLSRLPYDLSVYVKAGGALRAEIHISIAVGNNRRWTGIGIFAVDRESRPAAQSENLDVPKDFASRCVKAKHMQRAVRLLPFFFQLYGGRQIH